MYHYTYRLDMPDTGEYYFGSRTCNLHPTLDCYMGSIKSWRPDKLKLVKTIIDLSFNTREECVTAERLLILEHKSNSLNRNYHIPGVGFHTVGLAQFKDEIGRVFRLDKNDPLVIGGTLVPFWEGRKHSEESKKKQSISAKNKKTSPEGELKRRMLITQKLIGVKKPEGFSEHLSNIRKGVNNPMFGICGIENKNSKPLVQISLDDIIIKYWANAKIASEELGLSYKAINRCLNNKSRFSQGFKWNYIV